jgi:steroid 5-alpha reductase family enzyme
MDKKRKKAFVILTAAYLIAGFTAWFVLQMARGSGQLLLTLYADITATIMVFAASSHFRNSSIYDPYWSVAPIIIVVSWVLAFMESRAYPSLLVLTAVLLWGVRLTANWARGFKGLEEQDWRYTMFKERHPKVFILVNLGGIHLFPTLVVFGGLLPAYYAIAKPQVLKPGLFIAGFAVAVGATIIELTADEQMRIFKRTYGKGKCIETGLWRYSRHPNYFGECLFWWGLWIMGVGANRDAYWTALGPAAITFMFVFISIPMMEKRLMSSRIGYEEVKKRVSSLIPWPKK